MLFKANSVYGFLFLSTCINLSTYLECVDATTTSSTVHYRSITGHQQVVDIFGVVVQTQSTLFRTTSYSISISILKTSTPLPPPSFHSVPPHHTTTTMTTTTTTKTMTLSADCWSGGVWWGMDVCVWKRHVWMTVGWYGFVLMMMSGCVIVVLQLQTFTQSVGIMVYPRPGYLST